MPWEKQSGRIRRR